MDRGRPAPLSPSDLSLDAGTVRWEVQTTDPELQYSITGAPRVVQGKVVIGNGGAELGGRRYIIAQAHKAYDEQSQPSD